MLLKEPLPSAFSLIHIEKDRRPFKVLIQRLHWGVIDSHRTILSLIPPKFLVSMSVFVKWAVPLEISPFLEVLDLWIPALAKF